MKYFRLNADCFLVGGLSGGALYDVIGQRMFVLDQPARQTLDRFAGPAVIEEGNEHQDVMEFLDLLVREGLGAYHSRPVYVDKIAATAPVDWRGFLFQPPPFRKIDWSITNRCNETCDFCPHSLAEPLWQACRSCVRRAAVAENNQIFRNISSLVSQMVDLGIAGLHIRGGNPLLEWERLNEILDCARDYAHIQVVITTPGTGANREDVLGLYKGRNARLNIVLLNTEMLVEGKESDGESDLQAALLDALRDRGLPYYVTVNVSPERPVQLQRVSRCIESRWGVTPCFAEFLPRPINGNSGVCFSHVGNGRKPLYLWRNATDFFFRARNNTCLQGGMELAVDGSIRPCAGLDHYCGTIEDGSLRSALKGQVLYGMWKLAKGEIEGCDKCALRLACADCSAAELLGVQGKDLKETYCPLNLSDGVFDNADKLQHSGFVYRLSIEKGIQQCAT